MTSCYQSGERKVFGDSAGITTACVQRERSRESIVPLYPHLLFSACRGNFSAISWQTGTFSVKKSRKQRTSTSATAALRAAAPDHAGPVAAYVVGMGGSAGGLEAFVQFFSHLPADTGLAFVLVPHLEPTHKGMMPELLGRHTKMQGR